MPIYKAKIKIKERKKKRKCFHIINWIKIKKFDYLNLKSAYPKVTFLQLKGCNKDSVRSLIKGQRIYHTFLLYLGVARANRRICIISAKGQGAAQDPQWVQWKAMVGCPGGLAPGFTIFTYFRTWMRECALFCLQFTICVLRSGRMCRRWI